MGKIFDALEKAGSAKTAALPLLNHNNKKAKLDNSAGNIVALNNSTQAGSLLKVDDKMVAYHNPQSVQSEVFKVLRTNLIFPQDANPPRKILVTSALPNDGKSFVAANLAISIAKGVEEYVMLIDCDVRRPTIHALFGYGRVAGLSEHLANGMDVQKILLKTAIPKLTIMPSGTPPQNPTELLSSKKMRGFLDEAANRYDDRFILIDSPPPSVAAETSAIVNLVDGVIVVVKAGKTPKSAVNETIEQIGKEKIIGVVFNGSDSALKKYYGYNKSYYETKQ